MPLGLGRHSSADESMEKEIVGFCERRVSGNFRFALFGRLDGV